MTTILRLLLALGAALSLAVTPVAAAAMPAALAEPCGTVGHHDTGKPAKAAMSADHMSCCVAVDPGRSQAVNSDLPTGSRRTGAFDDDRTARSPGGADPPPPRLG